MTTTTRRIWLAAGLLAMPMLGLAQSQWAEEAEQAAPGTALFVVAIAVIATVYGALRSKQRKDLVLRFLDKGQEVPLSLLPPIPSRHRELRRATWLTGLGIGIALALYIATGAWRAAAWGLIPTLLGCASFLNAALFYPSPGPPSRALRRDDDGL